MKMKKTDTWYQKNGKQTQGTSKLKKYMMH